MFYVYQLLFTGAMLCASAEVLYFFLQAMHPLFGGNKQLHEFIGEEVVLLNTIS